MIRDDNDSFQIVNPEDVDDHRSVVDYGIPSEPSFEREYVHAKAFLQKCSTVTGDNLYDHLSNCLNKILAERPENVVDFFEEYSRKMKQQRFKPLTDHLRDIYMPPERFKVAGTIMPLFSTLKMGEDESITGKNKTNMTELLNYFERAGVGLPKTEMFYLDLSMKNFIRKEPVASIRFWGKIFGIKNNYLILECLMENKESSEKEESVEAEQEKEEPPNEPVVTDQDTEEPTLTNQADDEGVKGADDWPPYPEIPKPAPIIPPEEPPSEPSGIGVNKFVYYVCHQPGDEWIQLPDVTSQQIRIARQIVKIFTGDLDQEIITYPEFPGKEREYLRAQIARIAAHTEISPLNFYIFETEVNEYVENSEYNPVPIEDLVDKSMKFWVHHSAYILEQGRTTWWNSPGQIDDEETEGDNEIKPEIGPALLAPCFEDKFKDGIRPWSVYASSKNLHDKNTIAIVRSNVWPGGYSFATQDKLFQNIYFGNGLKTIVPNFSPIPLPPISQEYPLGPEIIEMTDPIGIEEKKRH